MIHFFILGGILTGIQTETSNDDHDPLEITVNPPFWKTWWAYMFYILTSGALIIWIYFYNLKKAKIRHNLILEKKMRSQEHELYEEKLNFFTNISHEIRTPLMLLINPLEDLTTKESKSTGLGRTLKSMYRRANSLLQLINMLLEFRKMEKGKLTLHARKHNIVEQVKENCLAFKGLTEKKNIQLDFVSAEEEINIWFDREKMEMILINLLSNAIKNTAGNKNITVTVSTCPECEHDFPEGKILIEVKDEEFLISVNRIILQNIENSDFSISMLHEELCMSRTVFYNKIKSLTNCSPIDLIREIRLRRAAELILTGKYKVFEVMFQVGFNDEKHFRHLFKNQYGVTPTEYQKVKDK